MVDGIQRYGMPQEGNIRPHRTLMVELCGSNVADVESAEACCRSIGTVHAITRQSKDSDCDRYEDGDCVLIVTFVDSQDCTTACEALAKFPNVARIAPVRSVKPEHTLYSAFLTSRSFVFICRWLCTLLAGRRAGFFRSFEFKAATGHSWPFWTHVHKLHLLIQHGGEANKTKLLQTGCTVGWLDFRHAVSCSFVWYLGSQSATVVTLFILSPSHMSFACVGHR
jgi:hypothetical protein